VNLGDVDNNFFDTVFIDISYFDDVKQIKSLLVHFHDKPTKYFVLYKQNLLESTWNDTEIQSIGDLLDDFMETHVRWQIHSEPFSNKNSTQLNHRIFILQGNHFQNTFINNFR
jgi:hypothetical protein